MGKVLISHARLAASPLGDAFRAAVQGAKTSEDADYVEIDADALRALIAQHQEPAMMCLCLRKLRLMAAEMEQGFAEAVLFAAVAVRGGSVLVEWADWTRIVREFKKGKA